ncbi:hypothetical protein ACJX0J_014237, partial [Zea mays]
VILIVPQACDFLLEVPYSLFHSLQASTYSRNNELDNKGLKVNLLKASYVDTAASKISWSLGTHCLILHAIGTLGSIYLM